MSEYRFSTIWKFPLKEVDVQEIQVPTATKPIHFGRDPAGALCMWAEVDPTKNKRTWIIHLVPTGGEIPDDDHLLYLGTFTHEWFVGHFYCKAVI